LAPSASPSPSRRYRRHRLGSLTLIAYALHKFSDTASFSHALSARNVGRRPAGKLMKFGYGARSSSPRGST
jgi:Co/Zn/Cd efflux system component